MKPLAFAADAGELIFIYGFSMAVSLFDRLRSARSQPCHRLAGLNNL